MQIKYAVTEIKGAEWYATKWVSELMVNGVSVSGNRHFTKEEAKEHCKILERYVRNAARFAVLSDADRKLRGWTKENNPTLFRFEKPSGKNVLVVWSPTTTDTPETWVVEIHARAGRTLDVQAFPSLDDALLFLTKK